MFFSFSRCWRGFPFYLESQSHLTVTLKMSHSVWTLTAFTGLWASLHRQLRKHACTQMHIQMDEGEDCLLAALLSRFSWISCPLVFRRSYFSNVLFDKEALCLATIHSSFWTKKCVYSHVTWWPLTSLCCPRIPAGFGHWGLVSQHISERFLLLLLSLLPGNCSSKAVNLSLSKWFHCFLFLNCKSC